MTIDLKQPVPGQAKKWIKRDREILGDFIAKRLDLPYRSSERDGTGGL